MENNETIGGKILSLRKAKGYTQADLGARLNISYQAVSKWERDESCPDFDTLSKIAQIFNVPITYFERGGEELATAQTAVASEQTREMLGVCKDCGKVVYEGSEGATTPALVCKDCMNARKLAVQRAQEVARQAQEKQRQEQAYRIGNLAYYRLCERWRRDFRRCHFGGVWIFLYFANVLGRRGVRLRVRGR